MASKSFGELERELASLKAALEKKIKDWKLIRKQTVKLLRALADEIQKHENNSRIAKLTGASTSIAGTSVAIGGAVAAFFTFGASLILTIVGASVAAAGGVTVIGTQIANNLLQSSIAKRAEEALIVDKEESEELYELFVKAQEVLAKIKPISVQESAVMIGKGCLDVGFTIHDGIIKGIQLGKIGSEAGETAFKALGNAARVLHVAGMAISAVTLVADIHTLVTTSVEVHNGSILEVVKDIRKVAQDLEDELNSFG